MEIVLHRINSILTLNEIPPKYGCEIDIRSSASQLILNHEPYKSGDKLIDYLENYNHGLLILNIKGFNNKLSTLCLYLNLIM